VDTARFHQGQAEFDWEFEGFEEFKELADPKRSAVIVTAHMASYDLGVYIFRQKIGHNITMVRAPEPDQRTQEYVHSHSEPSGVHVSYSGSDELISLELVHNLRRGGVVAIQGDRAIPGLSSVKASWFGNPVRLPAGPFALAMVTGAPIFPLFIARTGIRRYRVITFPPIRVTRTSEDRTKDWEKAAAEWSEAFESILRRHWHQWFAFEGNSRNQDDGTH
jgi:lauroyl/myristoyl acyltransferase